MPGRLLRSIADNRRVFIETYRSMIVYHNADFAVSVLSFETAHVMSDLENWGSDGACLLKRKGWVARCSWIVLRGSVQAGFWLGRTAFISCS